MTKRLVVMSLFVAAAVFLGSGSKAAQPENPGSDFDSTLTQYFTNYGGTVPLGEKAYLFVSSRTETSPIGPIVMIMDLADILGLTEDFSEGFITIYAAVGNEFVPWVPSVSVGVFTSYVGENQNTDPVFSPGKILEFPSVVRGEVEDGRVLLVDSTNSSVGRLSSNATVVGFELDAAFFWSWFADHYQSPNPPNTVADMLFNLFGPLSDLEGFVAELANDPTLYRALDGPILTPSMPLGLAFGPSGREGKSHLDHFMDYIHDLGLHRTKVSFPWSRLEPSPGEYDFEDLDQYLDQLDSDDEALVNIFTDGWCTYEEEVNSKKGAPLRECPKGETNCEKSCDEYYTEFITKVAERVRERAHGGVKYFQRDTEPASGLHFPADYPEEFCHIQHLFYQAVKGVLPHVEVIGVNHNGNFRNHGMGGPLSQDFFDYVLQHGKDDFDLLDVRLYEDLYAVSHRVEWFREHMKMYGYEKPIVSTEYGGPDPRTMHDGNAYLFEELVARIGDDCSAEDMESFVPCASQWVQEHQDEIPAKLRPFFGFGTEEENDFNEEIHCHDITQRSLMLLASGVRATWWWNLRSPGVDPIFGQMRLMTQEFQELPGYACFKLMVEKMKGVTTVRKVEVGSEETYLFKVLKGDEPSIFVAWHRDPKLDPFDAAKASPVAVELPIPYERVKITDVFGNTQEATTTNGVLSISLGDTPVFIETQ